MGSFHPELLLRPSSPDEVVDILLREKERARIVGGGTTIYEMANRGLLSEVSTLVDISGLDIGGIKKDDNQGLVSVGATATFTEMLESPILENPCLAAISDALFAAKPVQVRNVATIAGSVCSGIPLFDLPVALVVTDTSVVVHGPEGERRMPIKDFLRGFFTVDLKAGEFATGFAVPLRQREGSAFEKFALTGDDWAVVNCASSLTLDAEGSVQESRIAFGGGVTRISRAEEAERILNGSRPSKEVMERAASAAVKDVEFISDNRGSEGYRKRVAEYLLKSSLVRSTKRTTTASRVI